MKRIALAGMLMGAVGAMLFAQDDAAQKKVDKSKGEVEVPVKKAIADLEKTRMELPVRHAIADVGKSMAETPIKEMIAPADAKEGKVLPGRVAWHESYAAAMDAATKSGKPVLLFQLLGRLDDEWC